MKKNDVLIAPKKKKKKRAKKAKKITQEENDDGDYGIEDFQDDDNDEDLNEEELRDRKICQKCPEFKKVLELAEQIKKQFPQYGIDGERNIWIVKPAGSSRGRGICLRRNLVEIVALTKQIETQYIV